MRALDQASSMVPSSCDVLLICATQQEKARQSGQHSDQGVGTPEYMCCTDKRLTRDWRIIS